MLGSWGGTGLAKFTSNPPPFAFMRPGWLWMGAAAFSELIGGALVLLGLLTRVFYPRFTIFYSRFTIHDLLTGDFCPTIY